MQNLIWIFIVTSLCCQMSFAQDNASERFATVNDKVIPYALFAFLVGTRAQEDQQMHDPQTQQQTLHRPQEQPHYVSKIAKDLIVTELLAQEAIHQHIDERPEVITELAMARKTLLAQLFVQDIMHNIEVDESALLKAYQQQEAMTLYRFKIWTVPNKEDSRLLITHLNRPDTNKDDANIANAYKDHVKESAWVLIDDIAPSLREEVKKLPLGGLVTEAIQASEGWQVMQLIDKNTIEKQPYEQAREILHSELVKEALDQEITRLLKKASIQIHQPEGLVIDRQWSVNE